MKKRIRPFTSIIISAVMLTLTTNSAFAYESYSSKDEDTYVVSEDLSDTESADVSYDKTDDESEAASPVTDEYISSPDSYVSSFDENSSETETQSDVKEENITQSDSANDFSVSEIDYDASDAEPFDLTEEDLTNEYDGYFESDSLLYEYIEDQFGISYNFFARGICARNNLNFTMGALYDYCADQIRSIAEGVITDTRITVTADALGICETRLSASDLGISSITNEDGDVTDEAAAAFAEYTAFDYSNLYDSLRFDMPSETYWMGLTYLHSASTAIPYVLNYENGEYTLSVDSTKKFIIYLTANDDYADTSAEPYTNNGKSYNVTVDSSKTTALNNAITNAKSIVSEAADSELSDIETLNFYFNRISSLSSYNYDVSKDTPYGDPWQIIYMFDNDPDTKVVCEGYSKSFQYLCDMTEFDSPDIYCISVTGVLTRNNYKSGDSHMWNILHMDDGRNYLVDITNCSPANPILYMKSYSGIYELPEDYISYWTEKGYSFNDDTTTGYSFYDNSWNYVYYASTINSFSDSELSISPDAYEGPIEDNYCTVTFVPNNGEDSFTVDVTKGTAIGELPTPSYGNAEFDGWYDSLDDTANTISSDTICNENATYYARWTPSRCAITSLSYNPATGVTLSWGEMSSATSYVIEKCQKGKSWQVIATVKSEDGTSYSDNDVNEGYIYSYRLYAQNAYGDCVNVGIRSYYKSCAVVSFNGSLALSNTANGIKLSWNSAMSNIKYNIYRGTSPDDLTLYGTSEETTFVDVNTLTGTRYYYRVVPYIAYNNKNFEGYTSSVSMLYRVEPVTAPKLTNTASGIKLTWTKVSGADGYIIYRSKSGGSYAKVTSVSSGTSAWTDTSELASGYSYKYTIKAYVDTPHGTRYSPALSASLIRRLSQPTITQVKNATKGLYIKWTKTPYANGYYIYRSKNGGSYKLVNTVSSASSVSWNDTAPSISGAKYSYKIIAFKTSGGITYKSASSASFGYKLKKPQLNSVTKTSSGWTLSWNAVNGATGYVIYRSINGSGYEKVKTITSGSRVTWTNTRKGNTGDVYSYRIRAVKTADDKDYLSVYSSAKSGTR